MLNCWFVVPMELLERKQFGAETLQGWAKRRFRVSVLKKSLFPQCACQGQREPWAPTPTSAKLIPSTFDLRHRGQNAFFVLELKGHQQIDNCTVKKPDHSRHGSHFSLSLFALCDERGFRPTRPSDTSPTAEQWKTAKFDKFSCVQ